MNRFNGPDGAVRPYFHHQSFKVGDLAHTGALNIVVDLSHRTEHSIYGQYAHRRVGHAVSLGGDLIADSLFNVEFYG